MTALDHVDVMVAAGVATITINRPERLNAISAGEGGTRDQILIALAAAEEDDDVGCVVLSGAGGNFSSGGDLTANTPRESASEHVAFLERAEDFHRRLRQTPLPVVAAVDGVCFGAALSLVASCDLVVAARSARFGLPEGRIGLVGVGPLVPIVGRQWAKFLMFSGEEISAEVAHRIGLVLAVEEDDELHDRVDDLARRLARMTREALTLNKRAVDVAADAAGEAAGRLAAIGADAATLANSGRAAAPDGRTFREIIAVEGIPGLKTARAAQYETGWLR
jgi:enoyl-CoA hydratase/carnithine racemase